MQVYSEVLPLLPDVQYNAPARILTLRASGSRKQSRLPGGLWAPPAFGCTRCTAVAANLSSLPLLSAFAPAVPILIYLCGNLWQRRPCTACAEMSLAATVIRLSCAGTVAIISAGTSDEHVAEECRATADVMGCYCFRLADVSVDGLHRILHNLPGQLHVSCTSQAAETPNDESQHSPCNGRWTAEIAAPVLLLTPFRLRSCPQQSRAYT